MNSRCFNCNIYGHIAKNFQKLKKKKETRKYYKCDKVEYLVKNCRSEQKIKNKSIQKELDNKDSDKEESFVGGLWQVQYDKSLYIINLLINMLSYNRERKLNMYTNVKTLNKKKLQFKALIDSECTYTEINKQLVKKEQIKIESINRLFKVFNIDKTKNRKVIRFVLLELEINRHTEKINVAVIDLNSMNMFLEYDWLFKHNVVATISQNDQ